MAENVAIVDSGRDGDQLWFLSATGEEHAFQAEGRVSRIQGQPNRVRFTGTCILEDAPNRKLNVQGEATVTLVEDLRENRVEQQQGESAAVLDDVREESSTSAEIHKISLDDVFLSPEKSEWPVETVGSDLYLDAPPEFRGSLSEEAGFDESPEPAYNLLRKTVSFRVITTRRLRDYGQSSSSSTVLEEQTDEEGPRKQSFTSTPVSPGSASLQGIFTSDEATSSSSTDEVKGWSLFSFTPVPIGRFTPKSPLAAREATPSEEQPGPSRVHFEIEEAYLPSETTSSSWAKSSIAEIESSSDSESSFDRKLAFPPEMVRSRLVEATDDAFGITDNSGLFASVVVEWLTKRLLIDAADAARGQTIGPEHVAEGINNDQLLREMLNDVIIPKQPPPDQEE